MSGQFPVQFNNAFSVLPSANNRGVRRLFSEQCIVITATPQIMSKGVESTGVNFVVGIEVGTVITSRNTSFEWINTHFNEISHVRGWVKLPDLDTLNRDQAPTDIDVIAIYTDTPLSNVLIASLVTKAAKTELDVNDENFVGWLPMPDTSMVIDPTAFNASLVEQEPKYLCLVHFDDENESSTWDVAYIGVNQVQLLEAMHQEIFEVPQWSEILTANITHLCRLESKIQSDSLIALLESQAIKVIDCSDSPITDKIYKTESHPLLGGLEKQLLEKI